MSATLQWDGDCVFWDGSLVGVVEHVPAVAPLPRDAAEARARLWRTPSMREVVLQACLDGSPEEYRAHWSISASDSSLRGFASYTSREDAVTALTTELAWTMSAERNGT